MKRKSIQTRDRDYTILRIIQEDVEGTMMVTRCQGPVRSISEGPFQEQLDEIPFKHKFNGKDLKVTRLELRSYTRDKRFKTGWRVKNELELRFRQIMVDS